jgi:DNA-directed RNA polymerase subunit RPC12/RpoP
MMDTRFKAVQGKTQTYRRQPSSFENLEAMELYCPACRRPVAVRKYLLLVLPEGDKYEYRCQECGTVVGDKTERGARF